MTIGCTTGVYDMFTLRRASELCGCLIAGFTTDELTGKDKLAAWRLYRFNKMFAGSDWQGTPQRQGLTAETVRQSCTKGIVRAA